MPLRTPPRESRPGGRSGSARALPAGDAETQGDKGDGRHGKQHGECLPEQVRPSRRGKTSNPDQGDPGAGEHQRNPGQCSRQVSTPGRRKRARRNQSRSDEKHRHEVDAQRLRSRTRHAAVAPARATSTRAAMASVASASWAKTTRLTAVAPNSPPKYTARTKSPQNAAYASSAGKPAAATAPICRQVAPVTLSSERYCGAANSQAAPR